MTTDDGRQGTEGPDIWVLARHREGRLEDETFGLIAEARRILSGWDGKGMVTAVVLGPVSAPEIERPGVYGADRVIEVDSGLLRSYHGELFARVLFRIVKKYGPSCILMAQDPEAADLSSRLAALMETGLVNRVVDFKIDENGRAVAVRPAANGYLFERIILNGWGDGSLDGSGDGPAIPVICFLPAVLSTPEPSATGRIEVLMETMDEQPGDLKTKVVDVIEADPEDLDLEDADIIVSGGRGVGKGASFKVIDELAGVLGGSVAGTRPVIDRNDLPYERQIGQTGKTVSPRLLINCGISGANEYTTGIEKSRLIMAVNTDRRARIFQFADIGVIGDVHAILPLLIARIKKISVPLR